MKQNHLQTCCQKSPTRMHHRVGKPYAYFGYAVAKCCCGFTHPLYPNGRLNKILVTDAQCLFKGLIYETDKEKKMETSKSILHQRKGANAVTRGGHRVQKCSCGFAHPLNADGTADTGYTIDQHGNKIALMLAESKLYPACPRPYEYRF
jgi:hypothetical protein